MKTFDWKDSYIDYTGIDITGTGYYVSILGTPNGNGTRTNPANVSKTTVNMPGGILSNGVFAYSVLNYSNTVGSSMTSTILKTFTTNTYFSSIRNLTIQQLLCTIGTNINLSAKDCVLDNLDAYYSGTKTPFLMTTVSFVNCIQKGKINVRNPNTNFLYTRQNTFVDIVTASESCYAILTGNSLFNNCTINIDETSLAKNSVSKYNGFNNCLFKIGNEAVATTLTGNTESELRASFVARCVSQGLEVPTINDFGTEVPASRWIFSKTSVFGDYITIKDSEIDKFSKLRGIYLGHSDTTHRVIPITTALNIPASINKETTSTDIEVQNNSISLNTSDVTTRIETYVDSKIIWLGGLCKLKDLNIIHNLPEFAGISPDSSYGLAKDPTEKNKLQPSTHYIVRSKSGYNAISSIRYNNVVYSSSILLRQNVFLTSNITPQPAYTDEGGQPEVFQVLDMSNQKSIQARLMRELPTATITSGNLQKDYWYFVEPTNLNDLTGYVTYKGTKRPALDSFLADSTATFETTANVRLRRCWKQDYNHNTETTDKAFWENKQKPYYFDIASNDLRCLLKDSNPLSVEMAVGEDGKYIASGHVEFYNAITGASGRKIPPYDNIVGSFLQLRIPITTINPM